MPTGDVVGNITGSVLIVDDNNATGVTTRQLLDTLVFGAAALDAVTVTGAGQENAANNRTGLWRPVAGGLGQFQGAVGSWDYDGHFEATSGGLVGVLALFVPRLPAIRGAE